MRSTLHNYYDMNDNEKYLPELIKTENRLQLSRELLM